MRQRRQFVRQACYLEVSLHSPDGLTLGRMTDFSLGGICCHSSLPLKLGQPVKVRPWLSGGRPLEFVVVHAHDSRFGLRFEGSLPELFASWLAELMSRRRLSLGQIFY